MHIDTVKEFFAETREDALALASTHYGVDEGELEVHELPKSLEISGLGERTVFLIGQRGAEPPRSEPPRDERRGRGRDRDRPRDRDRDRDRDRGPRAGAGGRRGSGDGGRRPRRQGPRGDRPEGVDDERLENLAREAAERVRRSGEAEILESMSSKERWVVHNFLREEDGVASESEGEGPAKRVKIVPA
ncbi:MAG: hypothetical protein J4G09_02295 [Proteobacteria bacterium]|nr:hypothetical protein [Pseudomonadota bacterium]